MIEFAGSKLLQLEKSSNKNHNFVNSKKLKFLFTMDGIRIKNFEDLKDCIQFSTDFKLSHSKNVFSSKSPSPKKSRSPTRFQPTQHKSPVLKETKKPRYQVKISKKDVYKILEDRK